MDISEKGFETFIEEHLVGTHGYRRRTSQDYAREWSLDAEMLLEFILATQRATWQALAAQHGAEVRERFLRRVRQQIDQRGTLDVLRRGVKDFGCYFSLAYFPPASTLNPEHVALVGQNIFSVVRQLHYSERNDNSLDLVLFLNGLPLLTAELKNHLTGQRVEQAMTQYRRDRDPKGEPLLQFRRCLVHFALDDDEVWMTTRLQGPRSYFLPFNRGNEGGAGNPPNPAGYATSYLWEEIWQPASLLELVGSFIHLERNEQEGARKERLIFPRYHQRDAVHTLIAHTRAHGPGHSYLIQHSAGSGKSNTIAWLAHRLATLHNEQDARLFDSVIIITDRRVLDRQLQETVRQFEQVPGVVRTIEKNSQQLADALREGASLIVTTLQKFPFIVNKVGELGAGRRFAIIIDEAHSSQTGESSKSLKAVLSVATLEEAEVLDSGAEPTGEDLVLRSLAARGRQPNLSFFAFTATPKPKTLELFGVAQPDGTFRAFHEYTMQQAIEERFILDVLENYTTFDSYFNLLKSVADDPTYAKSRALALLKRYVDLHTHTIAQKTALMVEHFWEQVRHRIPDEAGHGQAKAMIVTRSRLHAVRYKLTFDSYLTRVGYPVRALVAFSGKVIDGGHDYTEAMMNGFSDKQTAEQFKKPLHAFLIVAEKFQTGFDQPLLHTLYVDKTLSSVAAVQTLSRLNRTHPRKTETMVLDFANRAEDIQSAFAPYYKTTLLREGSDPNTLYDLELRLAGYDLYTPEEVAAVADLFLHKGERAAGLQPLLAPVVARYRYLPTVTEREAVKHDLQRYVRLYAFLSQLITFRDVNLERLYLFARLLLRKLPADALRLPLNVQESVDLESYRLQQASSGQIALAQGEPLSPLSEVDAQAPTEEEKAALSRIIQELNERFGTDFSDSDRVFFAELKSRLVANDSLRRSVHHNSRDNVRLLHDTLFGGVLHTMITNNFDLFKRINDDPTFSEQVRTFLFDLVYQELLTGHGDEAT